MKQNKETKRNAIVDLESSTMGGVVSKDRLKITTKQNKETKRALCAGTNKDIKRSTTLTFKV